MSWSTISTNAFGPRMVRVQNEVPGVLAKGAGPVLALVTQRLQLGEQARVEVDD